MIPASITIPGEELFNLVVMLRRAEEQIRLENEGYESTGINALSEAVLCAFQLAFGNIYLDCECDAADCPVCNGNEETDGATPLYRLMVERAVVGERQAPAA